MDAAQPAAAVAAADALQICPCHRCHGILSDAQVLPGTAALGGRCLLCARQTAATASTAASALVQCPLQPVDKCKQMSGQ